MNEAERERLEARTKRGVEAVKRWAEVYCVEDMCAPEALVNMVLLATKEPDPPQ